MIYELQSRPSIKAYRDDSIGGMLTSFSYLTMPRAPSPLIFLRWNLWKPKCNDTWTWRLFSRIEMEKNVDDENIFSFENFLT